MPYRKKEDASAYQKKRALSLYANGLCRCGKKAIEIDTKTCGSCKKVGRDFHRKRSRYRKSNGLCLWCGEKATVGNFCVLCSEKIRAKWVQLKTDALLAYGGQKCSCCGETEWKFLCIDHVFGGGFEHRKEVGTLYQWLKRMKYPTGFQVLCWNCNHAKFAYEMCPHKLKYKKVLE